MRYVVAIISNGEVKGPRTIEAPSSEAAVLQFDPDFNRRYGSLSTASVYPEGQPEQVEQLTPRP